MQGGASLANLKCRTFRKPTSVAKASFKALIIVAPTPSRLLKHGVSDRLTYCRAVSLYGERGLQDSFFLIASVY
jgi:hypothetical protein